MQVYSASILGTRAAKLSPMESAASDADKAIEDLRLRLSRSDLSRAGKPDDPGNSNA